MKNVSLLSKLFLVSALALPCGQAFGMGIVKKSTKSVAKQTFETIKTEIKKTGFFQRPIVKACIWAGSGFGGAAVWNGIMDVRGNEKHRFSPISMIMTAVATGAYGYIIAKINLNGRKIDNGFKLTFRNQKKLSNKQDLIIGEIKENAKKADLQAEIQKCYNELLWQKARNCILLGTKYSQFITENKFEEDKEKYNEKLAAFNENNKIEEKLEAKSFDTSKLWERAEKEVYGKIKKESKKEATKNKKEATKNKKKSLFSRFFNWFSWK